MSFWRKIQIKLKNRWNDYDNKKIILLVLFWLSIVGLFIGLDLATILSEITNDLTEFKYMWILLLFLPIPIASVKLGIKYKRMGYHCKKNIIGGSIMIFFYCLMSYFTIFYFHERDKLFDDYSYLTKLESKINFDFPEDGSIVTDMTMPITTSSYQTIATSRVKFYNQDEIKKLESSIKQSEIWTNSNSSYLQMLQPTFYVPNYNTNIYYLIYIEDLNIINTLPTSSGTYKTYYFEYNMEKHDFSIYEYYLFFSI